MSHDEQIEVALEDEYPFAMVPQWIMMANISDGAYRLYSFLLAHVNQSAGNREVWPSKDALAALMRRKRSDYIDPQLDELYAIGAVTVEKTKKGMKKRNKYTVRVNPPNGHEGPTIISGWYRARKQETAGQPVPHKNGVRTRSTPCSVPGENRVKQEQLPQQQQQDYEEAPTSLLRTPQAAHEEKPGSALQLFDTHPSPPSLNPEKPKTQRQKATRIPDHFQVTAEMVAWATENTPDVDGRYETAKFCDYWRAKSGASATKLDWVATWRNWMRTAQDRLGGPQSFVAARSGVGDTQAWLRRSMERAEALDAAAAAGIPVAGVWG